jgi:uncharacterized protein YbgA (DUF1722 family)
MYAYQLLRLIIGQLYVTVNVECALLEHMGHFRNNITSSASSSAAASHSWLFPSSLVLIPPITILKLYFFTGTSFM